MFFCLNCSFEITKQKTMYLFDFYMIWFVWNMTNDYIGALRSGSPTWIFSMSLSTRGGGIGVGTLTYGMV